jgi:exodeoxyribonuclease V alpha subunit
MNMSMNMSRHDIAPPDSGETLLLDLAAIDRAFARMLVRRVAPARQAARDAAQNERALDPLLWHTALLVSAQRAQGNSCLDLQAYAGRTVAEGESEAAFTLPLLEEWQLRLRVSGACNDANDANSATSHDPLERAPLVLDGHRLYLARYYDAERRVAASIHARLTASSGHRDPSALFATLFPATSGDGQAQAAAAALRSPLAFITGGPGTGKTTIAAKLLALLLEQQPTARIALAAPTGRAAARLGESMAAAAAHAGIPAPVASRLPRTGVTLHRLLGYRPSDDRFSYSRHHPLADDIIVLDEASMVDVLLMDALLAAARPDARLIVLGDPDQLASVDTGFVLGDVVRAADALPAESALRHAMARLTVSYRFGARPGIGALAVAARTGNADALLAALAPGAFSHVAWSAARGTSVSALLEPVRAPLDAYLASERPAEALAALGRFRVLTALRDGDAGVSGLNAAIERWLRQRGVSTGGWYQYRPVLITQNDPATQLFNGDVGCTIVRDGEPLVYFAGPDGPRGIAPSRLPAHDTAWSMTVHKAQGSEFDHVLLVLPDVDTRLLTRELLYTGITRARESVTLVGSEALLRVALARGVERASGLSERLVAPRLHAPSP